MMMNDIMKNELNEQEMNEVSGGSILNPIMRDMKIKEEEEIKKAQEANRQGAKAHGGGASGGW